MKHFNDKDEFALYLSGIHNKDQDKINKLLDKLEYPVANTEYLYIPETFNRSFNEDESYINHLILDFMIKRI